MKNLELDVIGLIFGVLISTVVALGILVSVIYMALKIVTIVYGV